VRTVRKRRREARRASLAPIVIVALGASVVGAIVAYLTLGSTDPHVSWPSSPAQPRTGGAIVAVPGAATAPTQAASAPKATLHTSSLPTPRRNGPSPQQATVTRSGSSSPGRDGLVETNLTATYPRLANYNGFTTASGAPFFADDNLIVARRGAALAALHRLNPRVLALLYERTLQADYWNLKPDMYKLYGLSTARIPPRWWLTTPGSRLTSPLDALSDRVRVLDPRPFAACQDVLVGGESMHVLSIAGHTLTVLRGYWSNAGVHARGTPVAPHYSYRGDLSNCRLDGLAADLRPWSFNMSSLCPRWHGLTWTDFLARRIALLVKRGDWSGVFYDNMSDLPPSSLVDTNGDGKADGGVVNGVNVWRDGERALLARTRRLLPGKLVMVNGDLLIDGVADGREMEGFPLIPGADLTAAVGAYLYDGAHGLRRTIVNADTNASHLPSAAAAQLTVGVAALGAGYAAYDYGWLRHGWPWWFDAYDAGGGAHLRAAVGPTTRTLLLTKSLHVAPGAIVLLDQEAVRVLYVRSSVLVVKRGVLGTQRKPHLSGTVLATRRQRSGGLGYLGLARGSARLKTLSGWAKSPIKVTLPRTGVDAHGVETLFSTGFYDPFARGTTYKVPGKRDALRTLTFSARGREGQQLWLRSGKNLVRLILTTGWRTYVEPIDGDNRLVFGVGRVRGHVSIKDVFLMDGQAFVFRRDFTHGVVIVNTTDLVQRLPLRCTGVLIGAGEGSSVAPHLLSLAPYRAAIVSTSADARC